MSEPTNPPAGGSYIRLTPDSEAIFVSGTDRVQTDDEKRALESAKQKARRKEPISTTTNGSE